jgi:hypothetical protein
MCTSGSGGSVKSGSGVSCPFFVPLMHRHHALAHRFIHRECGVLHAQRLEDPLLHDFAKPLAAYPLDHLAGPVDVGAVFPLFAGIEQQRRPNRSMRGRNDARLSVVLSKLIVVRIEEVIAKARGVKQQHPRGYLALRRAKLRLSGLIEAVEDLDLADLRGVGLRRRVEVQLAVFHQLQARRAGDRLGGREDGEDAVGGHRGAGAGLAHAECALIDVRVAVRCDRHDARHAGGGIDRLVEYGVGGCLDGLNHAFLPA